MHPAHAGNHLLNWSGMAASTADLKSIIRERLLRAQDQINEAVGRAGRSQDSVRLVVVTKAQPLRVVEAVIEAGARILGENYPEEAVAKIEAVRSSSAVGGLEWHMIGHLQGRKARLVAPHFDLIHSLDSVRLAKRLDGLAANLGRRIPVLLECNVGGEGSKQGWAAADKRGWPGLLEELAFVTSLPHLNVRGLMTMPPLAAAPEDSRPHFRLMRALRAFLAENISGADWNELSMGTSADFAVAIEEGATLVRIGEAIVGRRTSRETP